MAAGSDGFGVIYDKVTFVNKIPLVLKATSDDEEPTPGYMYQEVNQLTLDSGGHCSALLDFLVDRLDRQSFYVKIKVLRIMKYIVENGHPDFRQGLRRRSQGIVAAAKFSGPPDPLHGTTPYQLVRKAGQELSQLLFDVPDDDDEMQKPPPVVMKSTGGMGGGSSGSGSLKGFGSAHTQNKSLGETLVSGLKDLADRVIEPLTDKTPAAMETNAAFSEYCPPASLPPMMDSFIAPSASASLHQSVASSHHSIKPVVPAHRPGVAGGGWDDDDDDDDDDGIGGHGHEDAELKALGSGSGSGGGTGSNEPNSLTESVASLKAEERSVEESLVQGFVSQPGLPSRKDIDAFMKSQVCVRDRDIDLLVKTISQLKYVIRHTGCCQVNCEKALSYITKCITATTENQTMRALMLVERMVRTEVIAMDHLATACCPVLIEVYKTTAHAPCRAKARKLIRQLEKLCQLPHLFEEMPPAAAVNKENVQPMISEQSSDASNNNIQAAAERKDLLSSTLEPDRESPEWDGIKAPFASPREEKVKKDSCDKTEFHPS